MSRYWRRLLATILALVAMVLLIVAAVSVGSGFLGGVSVLAATVAAFLVLLAFGWLVVDSDDDDDDEGPGPTGGPSPVGPSGGHPVKSPSRGSVLASVALLPWFVTAGVAGATVYAAASPQVTTTTAIASALCYAVLGALILFTVEAVIGKQLVMSGAKSGHQRGKDRPSPKGEGHDDPGAPEGPGGEGNAPGDR